MAEAKEGDTVKVHYTGTLAEDGTEFDSSSGREPLEFAVGTRTLIPGFEEAVVGMAPGDTKRVEIASSEAYGPHHAEAVQTVQRSEIPPQIDLAIGNVLQATAPNGQQLALTVVSLDEETVTLDANHPLAGKDLVFEIELVEIV